MKRSRRRTQLGPGTVTLTAARTQRKPWSWGWRVTYCVLVKKKSYRAVMEEFAADGKHISFKYVRSCMADYNKYFNPNHRTDTASQYRERSLAADQKNWIYSLFMRDPELYFDECAAKFERV